MDGRAKHELATLLSNRLDETDLRSLALALDVNYEDLQGGTLKAKTISLIEHQQRRNQLDTLCEQIKRDRPDLSREVEKVCKATSYNQFSSAKPIVLAVIGVVVLAALVYFVWRPWYQSQTAVVYQVQVLDKHTNSFVQNAKVLLVLSGNNAPESAFTDVNGVATFPLNKELIGGLARLTVEKAGYAPVQEHINVTPNQLPHVVLLTSIGP
ncbi:MAG: carboxypeptidase regulatory-like domain-containing protein [Chloroflexi bacterium]|nr:carboxypeptidase regulatory-like domain-containing protein [Ardenticatenaceae bacterium]MBL1131275.1 carboxypeptidase regulatory-like domain-containing protein [Chloroflexota bacterium]NOG37375.1 carboxypeptidase regulatory-like domain-containing protein [Chloroflexota bacterium]GIK55456.1 MAG: hypothetical protein BroJett015_11190 [Chloroflexota bacterium]